MLHEKGQVGLLLMVVMGLLITLVLSFASRSLSDTSMSRQDKEQGTAFTLAESGVEQALNAIRNGSNTGSGTLSTPTQFVSGNFTFVPHADFDLYVNEGDVAYADLSGVANGTNITISWTKTTDNNENPSCTNNGGSGSAPAAIEIISIYGGTKRTYAYYNPVNCNVETNGFSNSNVGSSGYRSQVTYVKPSGGVTAIKIRPLYSPATIALSDLSGNQLFLIQSQATGGDASQQIEVKRSLSYSPSIFDFALFSGGTIVK